MKNWCDTRLRSLALIDSEQGMAAQKELVRRSKPMTDAQRQKEIRRLRELLANSRDEVRGLELQLKYLTDNV